MSVNRSPLLREIFQISYQGQCEKHFLICPQSEDCTTNLRIIFYTCGIVGKNFYFCGGNKCRHCEAWFQAVAIFVIAFNIK